MISILIYNKIKASWIKANTYVRENKLSHLPYPEAVKILMDNNSVEAWENLYALEIICPELHADTESLVNIGII